MKVLFINNFFSSYGGAEAIMIKEAEYLRAKGHEVYFFAVNRQPYFEEDYEYAHFFPEFTDYKSLSGIDSFKCFLKPFYNKNARDRLSCFLDIIKPDVVHLHNIYYHITPSVIEPCKTRDIPMVMTLHDPRLMCPGGTLMYRSKTYCKEQVCLSGNIFPCVINRCRNNSIKSSVIAAAENLFVKLNRFYDSVDVFLCPSQAMKNLAVKSGISERRTLVLNNFVSDSALSSAPEYKHKGYFLYVGRLAPEKKVDLLIEAMRRFPFIKLHIAGDGPEKKNLLNLARRINASNVCFLGYLNGVELEQQYKNCIATVLPCDWFESFGLTIIESFAYGKPVIGSNVGAIPELVEHNENGFVFQPGNKDELIQAIKKLYRDSSMVVEIGKKCRQKAVDFYSLELHGDRLLGIYNELITRAGYGLSSYRVQLQTPLV